MRTYERRSNGLTTHPLCHLAVTEDGVIAASAITGNLVRLWNIASGEILDELRSRELPIVSVAFVQQDLAVRIVDIAGSEEIYSVPLRSLFGHKDRNRGPAVGHSN